MKCKVCNSNSVPVFKGLVLNKYSVQYFHCDNCGFLQTEEPYWLAEAYASPINISDTGYMYRNIYWSKKLTILLSLTFDKHKLFLDYASGYGVFVRIMRDIGFDFYWDDKYTTNLLARGFEFDKRMQIEAITCFECFEHLVNPIEEIEKMLAISKTIIFSTELLPSNLPDINTWWYYGLEHGQHISLYAQTTFKFIAEKYKLNYYHNNKLHILTNKKIPKYVFWFLKLSKLGTHKIFQKCIKSKTWDDHIKFKKHLVAS